MIYAGKRNIKRAQINHSIFLLSFLPVVIALKNCHSKVYNSTKERRENNTNNNNGTTKNALNCVCVRLCMCVKLKMDLFWSFWCDIKLLSSQSKQHLCELMCNTYARMRRTRHRLKESVNHLNASWLDAAGFNWSLHRRRCQIHWAIPTIRIMIIGVRCRKNNNSEKASFKGLCTKQFTKRNLNSKSPLKNRRNPFDEFKNSNFTDFYRKLESILNLNRSVMSRHLLL